MPRRRIGSLSASIQRSPLRARRRSPRRSTYTQVRSRTAVIRTVSPARVASKPSIRTSSSSSSTSLRRRDPPGRTLVESWSCGRGPWDGLGLMVSLDEAEPGSRIPVLDVGEAGLAGSGLGMGSGAARAVAAGAGLGVALVAGRLTFGGDFFAVEAARGAGPRDFAICGARGAPLAPVGFFDGRLDALTPQLPDPADRVRHGLQSYDGRPGGHLRHLLGQRVRNALGVDADHAVVDTAFLHDERAHRRVTLEPAGARDLQPSPCNYIATHQPGQRDAVAADVRLDVGFGPHQQVSVAVDLAAEVAQDLSRPFQGKPAGHRVLSRQHRRFGLEAQWIGAPVRAGDLNRFHPNVGHFISSWTAPVPLFGRLPPTAA